jgi:hypothetical protein
MDIQKFSSPSDMIQYLKGLQPSDHFKIAKSVGIKPDNKADARLYADYIVQGVNKGFSGDALVHYAKSNVPRIQSVMPHLKEQPSVVVPAPVKAPKPPKIKMPKRYTDAATGNVGASVAKPKAPKAPKKAKLKFEDFTIVPRPDRGGYEGWYGGKAEAFRETAEKVHTFFQKKYQRAGNLLA